jgi:hypothetical protein
MVMHTSLSLYNLIRDELSQYGQSHPMVPQHLGATGITVHRGDHNAAMLKSNCHNSQIKSFSDCLATLISLNPTAHGKKKKKEKRRRSGYRYYSSPAPSGGLRVADEGTRDDRDSQALQDQVQRVSISSLDRSAL